MLKPTFFVPQLPYLSNGETLVVLPSMDDIFSHPHSVDQHPPQSASTRQSEQGAWGGGRVLEAVCRVPCIHHVTVGGGFIRSQGRMGLARKPGVVPRRSSNV